MKGDYLNLKRDTAGSTIQKLKNECEHKKIRKKFT